MIYRGTTPKLDFTLPFNTELLDKAYITFFQKDRQAIEKEKSDCEIDTNKLILTLSQADTLKLVSNVPVKIQVRALLTDGSAIASKVIEKKVKDVLKDGEI